MPGDDEVKNDAHVIALELMKQIITLSTGLIGLSAAFVASILSKLSIISLILLVITWIVLLVAILLSLETVSAIVQSRLNSDISWSRGKSQLLAKVSKYLFTAGIAIFAAFSVVTVLTTPISAVDDSQISNPIVETDTLPSP